MGIRGMVAAAAVVALALTACTGGDSDDEATATSTTAAGTPVTAGPVPTTGVGASDQCPWFRGSTTALASSGPTAPGFLVEATAGAQGCLDVVTFTFQTRGDGTPPGYTVAYRDPAQEPFVDGDPPTEIEVPGNAFLAVDLSPALSTDPSVEGNPSTYMGNLSLGYDSHHHLEIVRELPDTNVDGAETVHWVIGLDSVRPFRVDRAENPPRIMVMIG